MVSNKYLNTLVIKDTPFDEPTCLQISYTFNFCASLRHVDFENCRIGPKGASLILGKLFLLFPAYPSLIIDKGNFDSMSKRLVYLNLAGNVMGYLTGSIIGKALADPKCGIKTLYLARNNLMSEGGEYIIRGLIQNISIVDIDLSSNLLDESIAESMSLVPRYVCVFVHESRLKCWQRAIYSWKESVQLESSSTDYK